MRGMDIRQLVADFTKRLHAAVDQISVARAREAVMHALGEKRGRLPRGMAAILGRKPRRKGPRQLCPVPGCQNAAAPVFGMVCAEHKDVSKTRIKQYREARRAAKLGIKSGPKAKSGAARSSAAKSGAAKSSAAKSGARPAKRGARRAKPATRASADGAKRVATHASQTAKRAPDPAKVEPSAVAPRPASAPPAPETASSPP